MQTYFKIALLSLLVGAGIADAYIAGQPPKKYYQYSYIPDPLLPSKYELATSVDIKLANAPVIDLYEVVAIVDENSVPEEQRVAA